MKNHNTEGILAAIKLCRLKGYRPKVYKLNLIHKYSVLLLVLHGIYSQFFYLPIFLKSEVFLKVKISIKEHRPPQ